MTNFFFLKDNFPKSLSEDNAGRSEIKHEIGGALEFNQLFSCSGFPLQWWTNAFLQQPEIKAPAICPDKEKMTRMINC